MNLHMHGEEKTLNNGLLVGINCRYELCTVIILQSFVIPNTILPIQLNQLSILGLSGAKFEDLSYLQIKFVLVL